MMKIKIKFLIIIILLNFDVITIFSDSLILNNGKIHRGKLIQLNLNDVIYEIEDVYYKINLTSIDNINLTDYPLINITIRENNKSINANLIKITNSTIFYKRINYSKLSSINIKKIKNMHLMKYEIKEKKIIQFRESLNYEKMDDINKDLDIFIDELININSKKRSGFFISKEKVLSVSRSNIINIKDDDFYEKIWDRVILFLDSEAKNSNWLLLEQYTLKEKYLNLIYNEKNKIKIEQENDLEIDNVTDEIIELRKDFYIRLKKNILNYVSIR